MKNLIVEVFQKFTTNTKRAIFASDTEEGIFFDNDTALWILSPDDADEKIWDYLVDFPYSISPELWVKYKISEDSLAKIRKMLKSMTWGKSCTLETVEYLREKVADAFENGNMERLLKEATDIPFNREDKSQFIKIKAKEFVVTKEFLLDDYYETESHKISN